MGSLESEELSSYDERQLTYTQVGSMNARLPVKLMRVGERGKVLHFLGDVQLDDVYARRREVITKTGRAAWWRLEMFAEKRDANWLGLQPKHGDEVVVAEYPWSSMWFESGRFRNPRDEGSRASIGEDWDQSDPGEIVRHIEHNLATEPFFTDKKANKIVAGISNPDLSLEMGTSYDARSRVRYVFGLCRERERLEQNLFASDPITECMRLATSGKLHDFSGINLVPDALRDDVSSTMWCSIRQSLAGPPTDKDSERLKDRPVHELAIEIFKGHMSTNRKREWRRKERERSVSDALDHRHAPEPSMTDRVGSVDAIAARLACDEVLRDRCAQILVQLYDSGKLKLDVR